MTQDIIIYVDGSCNSKLLFGAWAAILQVEGNKIFLTGIETNTTHNRMEMTAVIKVLEYVKEKYLNGNCQIFTDSQLVFNLTSRKEKLLENHFITSKGKELPNKDLMEKLIRYTEILPVVFIKVRAHQKSTSKENLNREVDMICRKTMRDGIRESAE